MKVSRIILWLTGLTALTALIAAGIGLLWMPVGDNFPFTTVRGETVTVYGQGLYYYDSLLIGAGLRGTDLVTLILALPLLFWSVFSYSKSSLRGAMLLAGALSYFLYNAVSLSFGAAYNNLMLLYVVLLFASLTAFVMILMAVDATELRDNLSEQFPQKGIARFLIAAGIILTFVWLSGIIPSLMLDQAPIPMGHYTTVITYPLDLGIIAPYCVLTGMLMLRRNPLGYVFASPLLVLCTLIGIVVLSQTAFQLNAGVPLTTAEIVIYAVSFMTMALASGWFSWRYFRSIPA